MWLKPRWQLTRWMRRVTTAPMASGLSTLPSAKGEPLADWCCCTMVKRRTRDSVRARPLRGEGREEDDEEEEEEEEDEEGDGEIADGSPWCDGGDEEDEEEEEEEGKWEGDEG